MDADQIKDRVTGLERHRAGDLENHPHNWRTHDEDQAETLTESLEGIGIADVLLGYHSERNDGRLTIIDGHLRKERDPDQVWPVVVTDLNDQEADALLLVHFPISAMAGADKTMIEKLIENVKLEGDHIEALLAKLCEDTGALRPDEVKGDMLRDPPDQDVQFVRFKFGDYDGLVGQETYSKFVAGYRDRIGEGGTLDDVLRAWLVV